MLLTEVGAAPQGVTGASNVANVTSELANRGRQLIPGSRTARKLVESASQSGIALRVHYAIKDQKIAFHRNRKASNV